MSGGFDLTGRVAVVTGASRGIGEGVARCLADAGASVVLGARSGGDIDAVARAIRSTGGRATAVRCDVTDLFDLGTLATAAVDEFGHLDLWVNNAGALDVCKPLNQLSRKEWDDCLALNLTAVWDGSMAAAEQMAWGSIVNVSSLAAVLPMPNSGHYAACKAAVDSLTRTMAHELAPDIRVNAVAPGPVATSSFFAGLEDAGYQLDQIADRLPLGLGTPADIGYAVVYLASDAARWVTGQTLTVTGGFTGP